MLCLPPLFTYILSSQWPTWPTAEGPAAPTPRNPPPAPYNPLASIDAKRASTPPPPPTIALSTSTSFHTIASLEDLRAGIYDLVRGTDHEHACRTDVRRPGPARKVESAPTITLAPVEEEADLTELLHSPALFFAERRPATVGHLAVPAVDHTGRLCTTKPKPEPAPRPSPLTRTTHNAPRPPFTRTPTGPRRVSLPLSSSRRTRSSKENASLTTRL
jgi:hypothetical protein